MLFLDIKKNQSFKLSWCYWLGR